MAEVAIVVHGGAGAWRADALGPAREGVRRAVEAGHAVLRAGGEALDAVQAAVVLLEDDPVFNAGRGSVQDERGDVVMDAAVMRGADRAAGAVAALRGIRNPILAARAVLDERREVLLTGESARELAVAAGLATAPDTWLRGAAGGSRAGTVGAVARDARGSVAAATSTGGTHGKRPGRVGDSPLPGAGTWADDATAAISCTGDGEAIIRAALAHEVDVLIRIAGLPLGEECDRALARLAAFGTGGLIAIGAQQVAARFTTGHMPHGWRIGDAQAVVDA
jgi:beta-aspartyl-peptidase (threonine type)